MSESLRQVKRDSNSKALINTSNALWRKRQQAKKEKQRIDNLEAKVDKILQLLKEQKDA